MCPFLHSSNKNVSDKVGWLEQADTKRRAEEAKAKKLGGGGAFSDDESDIYAKQYSGAERDEKKKKKKKKKDKSKSASDVLGELFGSDSEDDVITPQMKIRPGEADKDEQVRPSLSSFIPSFVCNIFPTGCV